METLVHQQDQQDQQDQMVMGYPVQQDQPDHWVQQTILLEETKDQQEHQDRQEIKEKRDHKEIKVLQVKLVRQEKQAQPDLLDRQTYIRIVYHQEIQQAIKILV